MTPRTHGTEHRATKREEVSPPPEGPPWDSPIGDAPLVFLDLEMTGLDAARDRVIEVCAERVVGGVVEDALATLVRPDCGTFGSGEIHGIAPEELTEAPTFAAIAERIEALVEGGIVVAHAAAWDVAFLEAELARAGRTQSFPHFLDTLTLSRRAFALPSHSLAALCAEHKVSPGRAHRAADDVHALRELWPLILTPLSPATPRDLWHVRIGERHARPEILAAALTAAERGAPVQVRYRPSKRGIQTLTMCVTEVRTNLDPPRVLGYLLPSRGRRDLRADRILAIDAAEPSPPKAPHRS